MSNVLRLNGIFLKAFLVQRCNTRGMHAEKASCHRITFFCWCSWNNSKCSFLIANAGVFTVHSLIALGQMWRGKAKFLKEFSLNVMLACFFKVK